MKVKIEPGALCGTVTAPPSKSLTHRKLICSALSGRPCRIENVMLSEDILATMDCLSALGAEISRSGNTVTVDGSGIFVQTRPVHMPCRASGSTLRFLLPVVLALGRPAVFDGEASLFCRPLGYYEDLCRNQGILWEKGADSLSVSGRLQAGTFEIPGERSSQFVTGMLFALPMLPGQSEIRLIPPVTSRPYIRMTQAVLRDFSIRAISVGDDAFHIPAHQKYRPHNTRVEGDWTNGAVLLALNLLNGGLTIKGLDERSVQGDTVSNRWLQALARSRATFDLTDNPDLAPLLMACAAALHGVVLNGAGRLQYKESDRGAAMAAELEKFGATVFVDDDRIWVDSNHLHRPTSELVAHSDHRIAMSLAVLCTLYGGTIRGAEAVDKSWPGFFDVLRGLGLSVTEENDPEPAALPAGGENEHESGL